jgi:1-deoxy-D-xylulose 5-phosphate reductoisomerase
VLNAANEVAVSAFLELRLAFPGIAGLIAATLDAVPQARLPDLATVLAKPIDRDARWRRKSSCDRCGSIFMNPQCFLVYVGAFALALGC